MSATISLMVVFLMLGMLVCQLTIYRHRQKEMYKHDRVLFPFCQLRRNVIRFLHENVVEKQDAVSKEERESVRRLLDIIDLTIGNYNENKTVMFNLRTVMKNLKTYRSASEASLQVPDHPRIKEFHSEFRLLLVKAFFAYTPLIKSEFKLYLVVWVYRAVKREGATTEALIKDAAKARQDARHYGLTASPVV